MLFSFRILEEVTWMTLINMQAHKIKVQTEKIFVSIPNPAQMLSGWELHLTQIHLLPTTKSANTGK